MTRVKKGKEAHKKRKKLLKKAKGFNWGRKSKFKKANEALKKAWSYAYRDRRTKKREFRKLWQTQINAAARQHGLSYSKFMGKLKKKGIKLNRKMLAEIAKYKPEVFEQVVEKIKE